MDKFLTRNFEKLKVNINFSLWATILAGDPLEVGCYGNDEDGPTIEITENVSVFIPKEGAIISTTLIVFGVIFFPSLVGATSFIKNGDLLKNKLLEGKQEAKVKNDTSIFNSEKLHRYISSYFSKEAWFDYFSDPFKVQPETKLLIKTGSSIAASYFALKLLKNHFSLLELNKKMLVPAVKKVVISSEILTTVNKNLPSGLEKFFYNQKMLTAKELAPLLEKKRFVPTKPIKPTSLELIIYEPPKKWGS